MAAYLPVNGREWTEESEMGERVAKKGNPVVGPWGRRRRGPLGDCLGFGAWGFRLIPLLLQATTVVLGSCEHPLLPY